MALQDDQGREWHQEEKGTCTLGEVSNERIIRPSSFKKQEYSETYEEEAAPSHHSGSGAGGVMQLERCDDY